MKRVKTALLFNDKYKQGYSYIMATTPISYSNLTAEQKIQYAKNVAMSNYGVTQPNTTQINTAKLDNLVNVITTDLQQFKQISSGIPATQAIPLSSLPPSLRQYVSPPNVVPPTTLTLNDIVALETGVLSSLKQLQANPTTLPAAGASVSPQPVPPAAPIPALPTNTTSAVIPAAATATPALPINTTPTTTTAPSTNPPNSTLSNILTAAAVVGGGAIVVNALNNRVQNTTPTPVTTPTATTIPEVPQTSPTTVATQVTTTIPLIVNEQQPINPNSDPNTNIGELAQDLIYEPLQEPPPTEVDEFTGIDEQVERQRQLEDGSLEFAGIDDQIAANENILQEPPQLSDDEVNDYLRTAGQDETITSPNSITENVFDPTGNNGEPNTESVFDPTGNQGAPQGISTSLRGTQGKATDQDVSNFQAKPDWRVRLSLAPGATYLYKDKAAAGILAPLAATDGVIFPYTPAISVQYAASYDATELTHSNYKFFTYRGSAVDSVSITCDFTAQDTFEANYLLAVIHFFRSVTKMFYGQDQNPKNGTPPPLCYLSGLGAFQFDAHPLAITSFNYTLPTDVDYIRAGATPTPAGVTRPNPKDNSFSIPGIRLGDLQPGGGAAPAQFNTPPGTRDVTYVPTKMSISIQAVPIVTRNDISNKFSLKEYGTGKLLRGTQRQGGGIW